MNAQVIVQDTITNIKLDISDLIISLEWTTTLDVQPGKLTFTCIDDKKIYFVEGSRIAVIIGGVNLFSGFIFKRERSEATTLSVTAYDQMRYLQNKDIVNMPILTSSQVFEKICKEQGLKYNVIHPSAYICAARIHDNKSYFEMIQTALDDTLRVAGEWYYIRDNYGILEHVSVEKSLAKAPVIIGDGSLVTAYKFESSIDDDTFNQVKLTKDNKKTAKRDVYIAYNSEFIARWGRLQYYESVPEDSNEAQIKAKADRILELKNRPSRSLSVECLGDTRIRAGNGVILNISELIGENIPNNKSVIVYSCVHKFENDAHRMSLELEVI